MRKKYSPLFISPGIIRNVELRSFSILPGAPTGNRFHPHENNFDVYGHQIRNLIILATTEVESSLTAILQANNIAPLSQYFTTRDYVRLKKVLRLAEFEVSLSHYPWLQSFSPFRDWNDAQPT